MGIPAVIEKPPLYETNGQGSWRFNGEQYSDEESTLWTLAEADLCRESPLHFLTHYCYTINANQEQRGKPPAIELMPHWSHISAVVFAFTPTRDVVIEKSRQMTVSWSAMAMLLHDLLWREDWADMTLSRVEDLVDDGGENSTVQSLHGKIRFMWDRLPVFLKKPLEFKSLSIVNPVRNTLVRGFSATPSAGRGGTWRRAVLDEFAWVPHSEQVMNAVTLACPNGKVLISTPNGKANAFARIRGHSVCVWPYAEVNKHGHLWERFTLHWSLHPLRDKVWYKREIKSASMTDEAVAQEMDISYTRSLGRRVYPKYIEEKHMAGEVLCRTGAGYDQRRPIYICCDFNHDPLIWCLMQVFNETPRFRVFGEICRRNAIVDDSLREFFVRFGPKLAVDALLAENAAEEWDERYGSNGICVAGEFGHQVPVIIHGDATEEKSTVHNRVKTYQQMSRTLRDWGFIVTLKVPKANPPRARRIELLNHALGEDEMVIAPEAEQLRKDLQDGVWNGQQSDMDQNTEDDDGSHLTRSHASSAIGYAIYKLYERGAGVRTSTRPRTIDDMMPEFIKGWA